MKRLIYGKAAKNAYFKKALNLNKKNNIAFGSINNHINTKSFSSSSSTNEKLFNKILIANRGEITCRVIKTARKLGIKTVAVYSDADANAKHVQMADEAYYLGPSPVNQSYLVEDKIMEALHATNAEAIHPGYGFLSENAHFSERVEKEGFAFIGPPAAAIRAMGDKIQSKVIAGEAGVNTIPGFKGEVESADRAIELARDIGYPVMIKASAGGGGKGMRIAWNDKELVEGFNLSRSEAENFFGDNKMLIEKFIEDPKHIEIQIICDKHGNKVYLPERECSIQRRNQKVIEEAPSKFIDQETRDSMGKQAIALAEAVDYVSAGTVEMLVDPKKNFYFLEMNTRLQVEHPITEYITGVDLVEQMLLAAANKPLSIKQEDVKVNGWATECRVYAEDPAKNYAPSIGVLDKYVEPTSSNGTVRVDSGILEGSEISVYYDPMISKLITYGKTREESINKMVNSLDTYIIHGVKHNIPLLRDVLEKPNYRSGKISTNFLKEEYPEGFNGVQLSEEQICNLLACASVMELIDTRRNQSISGKFKSHSLSTEGQYVTMFNDTKYNINVMIENNLFIVEIDNKKNIVVKTDWYNGETIFRATLNDKHNVVMQHLSKDTTNATIQYLGTEFHIDLKSQKEDSLLKYMPVYTPPDYSKVLIAPMPGSILKVAVQVGDKVTENQTLVTMEAMKMQNDLRSKVDGTVKAVHIKKGDIVKNSHVLIEFE